MQKIIRITAGLTIGNILSKALGLLFLVILAWSLPVEEYGNFRYMLDVSILFGIFFSGISVALTKALSSSKTKEEGDEYISISLLMSSLIFFSLAIIIYFTMENPGYLVLFELAILADSLYSGFARGILNYLKIGAYKAVENLIQLVILIISFFIMHRISLWFAVIFYCFSGPATVMLFEIYQKEISFTLRYSAQKIKKLLKFALPVTLNSIGWSILFSINSIFIKRFLGTEEVGFYGVGVLLVQIYTFFPLAISTILLPKAAKLRDKREIIAPLILAVIGNFFISFLMMIFLLIFGKKIIGIVFSAEYLAAAAVILPLSICQIFISGYQIYSAAWQGFGKPGIPSIAIGIAALLNVIGSYVLTQRYGIFGSALSTAVSSIIAFIIIASWFHIGWDKYFGKKNKIIQGRYLE